MWQGFFPGRLPVAHGGCLGSGEKILWGMAWPDTVRTTSAGVSPSNRQPSFYAVCVSHTPNSTVLINMINMTNVINI